MPRIQRGEELFTRSRILPSTARHSPTRVDISYSVSPIRVRVASLARLRSWILDVQRPTYTTISRFPCKHSRFCTPVVVVIFEVPKHS